MNIYITSGKNNIFCIYLAIFTELCYNTLGEFVTILT